MHKLCDLCKYQESNGKGGVQCGAAQYSNNLEGYGSFKTGAQCIHDSDLKSHFSARTGNEISVRNLSNSNEALKIKNHELERKNFELKRRLTKI